MSAVAIIPAKGTSRRVPSKNRKMFHGHPIIYYSIKAAQDSGLFDRIVVSTDDDWIGRYAEGCGAMWYARQESMCGEEVGTQEVAADFLRSAATEGEPYKYACCIYPCAPMLTAEDLRTAAEEYEIGTPAFIYATGYFYWGRTTNFLDDLPLTHDTEIIIPAYRYIDINTPDDWAKAEAMYAALHKENV